MFVAFKLAEMIPVVGPKVSNILNWIVHLPIICWSLKYKDDWK